MAVPNQGQSGVTRTQEFTVVVDQERKKKISIMQFQPPLSTDIARSNSVVLQRENNLKEYKSAHNIGLQPQFGAGSEFGKEAKEEARRRKFGYIRKNYNPDAQPWMLKIGPENSAKQYKGTKNGGIVENTSYFIFSKRNEREFEATPVEEWYTFKPTNVYNSLNAEEAEEEFARRDKTLNMFSIMVSKRLTQEDGDPELKDDKEKVKKAIKSKGLMLTEMEDWDDMSDEDETNDFDSDTDLKGKGKGKAKGKGHRKKKGQDTDDEAVEESDDGDDEGKQIDYMSDTSESDSDMEERANKSKYEEKGVEDEDGLREIMQESEDEKEPEKGNDNENNENSGSKEKGGSSDSSSSDSESDDPDKEDNDFTKAFLMTGNKKERGRSPAPRSATPTTNDEKKRKAIDGSPHSSPAQKKIKQESQPVNHKEMTTHNIANTRPSTPGSAAGGVSASRDGLTEEAVKRYLLRKPMSSKDLFKIFKSKKLGMSNEELVTNIANILKRLKTAQQKINGVIHFSISEK